MKNLGEAVVDRLRETATSIEFTGESYRILKRKVAWQIRRLADSRITANLPAGISEPAWKNPVNGHDFKNDPERDNHLFDFHKVYHAKDDG